MYAGSMLAWTPFYLFGAAMFGHGADQFMAGGRSLFAGRAIPTASELILQKAGMSPEWASVSNNLASTVATAGALGLARSLSYQAARSAAQAAMSSFGMETNVNGFQGRTNIRFFTKAPTQLNEGLYNLNPEMHPKITNPFQGKTFEEIAAMFKMKNFRQVGPQPEIGRGSYFNPKTGRRYYLDPAGKTYRGNIKELPHVDVYYKNHIKGLEKKRFPLGEDLYEFQ